MVAGNKTSLYQELLSGEKSISITGLGYVGLPLALEFARHFKVVGFDVNVQRIELMKKGVDPSNELDAAAFDNTDIEFTFDPDSLAKAHFHIVSVPTDIDEHKVPDLRPLYLASANLGRSLKKGDYVVFESTVFPGCTEEECIPILEKQSGLTAGTDFFVGYSPERIVPGEKVRTLTQILKIVGANEDHVRDEIADIYGHIIEAGIHKVSSIKVAEAAKVIENTQRDLNISLVNELAIIFTELGISTNEVIEAAGTKWNFHKYYPGLVGGHCISVDPFYLLHKARQVGQEPRVIAAGRNVNEYMPVFIASRVVKNLTEAGINPSDGKVLVLGITFKENVSDVRNSKVVDLVKELREYQLTVDVHDPHADPEEVLNTFGIELIDDFYGGDYNAVILAVAHKVYAGLSQAEFNKVMQGCNILCDIKGIFGSFDKQGIQYWTL